MQVTSSVISVAKAIATKTSGPPSAAARNAAWAHSCSMGASIYVLRSFRQFTSPFPMGSGRACSALLLDGAIVFRSLIVIASPRNEGAAIQLHGFLRRPFDKLRASSRSRGCAPRNDKLVFYFNAAIASGALTRPPCVLLVFAN